MNSITQKQSLSRHVDLGKFLWLSVALAILTFAGVGRAANVVWNGSTSGDWATAGNWTGGTPAGNDVYFYASGASNLSNFLSAAVSVNSLNFTNGADSSTVYSKFTTAPLTLNGGVTVTAGNHTLLGPGVSGNVDIVLNTTPATWNIASGCTLTNLARTVRAGSGLYTKSGNGTLIMGKDLSGSSAHKGTWLANGGILRFTVNGAFGTSANNCTNNGGTIELVNANCAVTTLALNGTGYNNLGALHLVSGNQTAGSSVVLGSSASINVDSGATLTIASAISGGSSSLTKIGDGILALSGASTFTGNANVNAGTLMLTNTGSLSSGTISVGTGATFDVSGISFVLGGTQSLIGSGTVNGNVTDSSGSGIRPAGSGVVGNLTFNNDLTLAGGDTVKFDFSNTNNDLVIVGGTLTPNGVTTINLATPPPSGYVSGSNYVLIHVLGTLGGDTNNFTLTGIPVGGRQSYALAYVDGGAGSSNLVLQVSGAPASLIWAGGLGGNIWDINTTANWTNGASRDVYYDVDFVSFTDAGLANSPVNVSTTVIPSLVTVSNTSGNYTLTGAGKISGSTGLTKTGAGSLTLSTVNDYSGSTVINGGSVILGAADAIPGGPGKGSTTLTNATLDLNQNSVTLNNLSGAGTVDTVAGGAPTLTVNNTATTTFAGVIKNTSGTLALTKTGTSRLSLSGNNTFGGGSAINAGTLTLDSTGALGSSGTISFGGGSLQFSTNNTTDYSSRFSADPGQLCTLDVPTNLTVTLAGSLNSSGGTLTKTGPGLLVVSGANNTYTGGTTIGGTSVGNRVGVLRATATQALGIGQITIGPNGGDATARLELSGGISLANAISLPTRDSSNPAVGIKNLSGNNTLSGTTTIASGANISVIQSDAGLLTLGTAAATAITGQSGTKTLYIQGDGNTLVLGDINNGTATAINIVKAGTGTLTLDGNNTSGNTTVSNGTLLVNSSIGSGSVTVQANGILGGIGSIAVGTTVSGGTLAPGTNGIGTLTVNATLTLNSSATNRFDVNGSDSTNDVIALGGAVTYGGVLKIVPTGTFTNSQTFTLFTGAGAASASNFANIEGTPGSGKAFTFTNGILSVIASGPDLSQNRLTNSVSGGVLQLSWSPGWKLQMQTNSLSVGLAANWVYVTDGTPTSTNITINASQPTVFYRLTDQ